MELVTFNARCPFEIGDKVRAFAGGRYTITDIACIHYVQSGRVEFRYQLDGMEGYRQIHVQSDEPKEGTNGLATD